MATRTVKARVEIDGEKQYKQAISELNTGNKTLASEMRKLQAEYKGNTESVEYLTKRGELLERQLLQQQEKVKTLRDAVADAAQRYGEADSKTQNWIQQLNNAEAAEFDLQHAIDENTKEMEQQGNTMSGVSDKVQGLCDQLGINLPPAAKKALDGMQGLSTGSVAAMAAAVAAVTGLVTAVKALHETTLEAAHEVDDVITKSMTTGLSTDTLQRFEYAENLIDVSVETMTGSLTKLTRNMASAQEGNEAMTASFEALGVSIEGTDGHLRSSEEVFYDVIDALGRIDNATERDAAAMEILGKSAQELNPLIIQGTDTLRALGEEAENAGYVLDEYQIKRLGEVDDAYQRMQLTVDATKKQLAADFAPASKAAMELFAGAIKAAADVLERSGIIEGLSSILSSLGSIIETGAALVNNLIPGANGALGALTVTLGGVAQLLALISDAANVVAGILSLDFNRVGVALGFGKSSGQASNWQRVYMQQNGTWDQYYSYYNPTNPYSDTSKYGYDSGTGQYYDLRTGNYMYGANASGNDNWRGGMTYLGENGAETAILPSGTRILSAQDTRNLGGDTYIFQIEARTVREFNDLIRMAENARVTERMR